MSMSEFNGLTTIIWLIGAIISFYGGAWIGINVVEPWFPKVERLIWLNGGDESVLGSVLLLCYGFLSVVIWTVLCYAIFP